MLGGCPRVQQRLDGVIRVGQGFSQHLHCVLANQGRGRGLARDKAAVAHGWTCRERARGRRKGRIAEGRKEGKEGKKEGHERNNHIFGQPMN